MKHQKALSVKIAF